MSLTPSEISRMLLGNAEAVACADWLRNCYLPNICKELSTADSRKRLSLYSGDRIPENERNLTDVRNRVSLILEYELARVSNSLLAGLEIKDIFWSYVVANRFPDLEVRKHNGSLGVRIEVKCLQSIAEEKSANFDTLKKDIRKDSDFLVVLLWEWMKPGPGEGWDRAPLILRWYVFHAYSLAELRDHYWLNNPPRDLSDGYQGFDLRYAVNCRSGQYNEEEGNYGKLLRIWQSNFKYRPVESPALLDTEREYLHFQREVGELGFNALAHTHLPLLSQGSGMVAIPNHTAFASGDFMALYQDPVAKPELVKDLLDAHKLKYAVLMNRRYKCTGVALNGAELLRVFDGIKPKALTRQRFGLA